MKWALLFELYKEIPVHDRIVAVVGGTTWGILTLGNLQTGVGIAVGVATLFVLVPRAIIGWLDARDRIRKGRSSRTATDLEE